MLEQIETEIILRDQHFDPAADNFSDKVSTSKSTNKQDSWFSSLNDELLLKEISSIPDKLGFKIGDVSELLGIKQYVIRYWETEFEFIRPKKASNNQRLYTKKDVENVYLIRKLLHRDRFSIEGAKSALKSLKTQVRRDNKGSKNNKDMEWVFSVQSKIHLLHEKIDEVLADIRALKNQFK
jgi:DNA-binding transcriptional MerR regulator